MGSVEWSSCAAKGRLRSWQPAPQGRSDCACPASPDPSEQRSCVDEERACGHTWAVQPSLVSSVEGLGKLVVHALAEASLNNLDEDTRSILQMHFKQLLTNVGSYLVCDHGSFS